MGSPDHCLQGALQYGTKVFWKIPKFSVLSETFKTVKTKEILLRENCIYKWKIVLEFESSVMYLGLQYCGMFSHEVNVMANFTVRNSKHTVFAKRTLQETFNSDDKLKFCDNFIKEPSNFLTYTGDHGIKFRLCKDDILIIEGNITSNCCEPNKSDLTELLQSLRTSSMGDEYSDARFEIGGQIITAHKALLGFKSQVFKKIFETELKENTEKKIILTDIDIFAFKTFLSFLYTGILDNFKMSMILQLFYLADKYAVQRLPEKCLNILFSNMSIYNVHEVLLLAHIHEEWHLYNSALHHFCVYFKYIEQTSQWKKFQETNAIFALQIEIEAVLYVVNE